MLSLKTKRALAWAAVIWAISFAWVHLGIFYGQSLTSGSGYPSVQAPDLFRFDAAFYKDIAQNGYSYNGDPASSPNIVFAPLFPLLLKGFDAVGIPVVAGGFVLNEILLFLALVFLFLWLETPWPLLALATTAGSYAFHAYYSESTMLFGLALALWSWQRRQLWWLAFACAWLGASRLAALPFVLVFSALLVMEAWRERRPQWLAASALAVSGAAAYLIFIAIAFGNPFELLPEIQQTSWGLFHPPADVLKLLDGQYLFEHIRAAFERADVLDIRTLNLIWLLLALAASVHLLITQWRKPITWGFVGYFILVYTSGGASEYLISMHRFAVMMLPIFTGAALVLRALPRRLSLPLALVLLVLSAAAGILHTAMFNQGQWYWF